MPINGFSIDVEEWYHVCGASLPAGQLEPRVRQNVARILELLEESGVRGTFFVLGTIAEKNAGLVREIIAGGHEVGSHGYSHRLVPELGPAAFRDELRRTAELIEHEAGQSPVGFRAPRWSLSRATPWAFEILQEEGYLYDSSLNPLPFVGDHRGSHAPFPITTSSGTLIELPPMVSSTVFGPLPTGGGWGFRFFPMALITRTIGHLNSGRLPAVLYIHPREVDPSGPRLDLSLLKSFIVYGPRKDASERLRDLFRKFAFRPLREVAQTWQVAS